MNRLQKDVLLASAILMSGTYNLYDTGRRNHYNKENQEDSEKVLVPSKDNRSLREFSIHGHRIYAYSKKDAITRLIHKGLIKKKRK